MQRKKVGIVVFTDVEVLDFCGPFEVFSVTRLDEGTQERSPLEVILVAQGTAPVQTVGGMKIIPDASFENCPRLDILVVPGGRGTRRLLADDATLNFIRSRAAEVETLSSVCTGSLLLGKAGLLDGLRATTHWATLDYMQELLPTVTVDRESHVVRQQNIFTSAGISAGIDMALHVVAHHCGEAVARMTARQMEYPYPESNHRRVQV